MFWQHKQLGTTLVLIFFKWNIQTEIKKVDSLIPDVLKALQFDKQMHQSHASREAGFALQRRQRDWPQSHSSHHAARQFHSGWRSPGLDNEYLGGRWTQLFWVTIFNWCWDIFRPGWVLWLTAGWVSPDKCSSAPAGATASRKRCQPANLLLAHMLHIFPQCRSFNLLFLLPQEYLFLICPYILTVITFSPTDTQDLRTLSCLWTDHHKVSHTLALFLCGGSGAKHSNTGELQPELTLQHAKQCSFFIKQRGKAALESCCFHIKALRNRCFMQHCKLNSLPHAATLSILVKPQGEGESRPSFLDVFYSSLVTGGTPELHKTESDLEKIIPAFIVKAAQTLVLSWAA